MDRTTAVILFLSTCLVLAVFLLVKVITFTEGGIIFVAALAFFGGLFKGSGSDKGSSK
jgi:hypothetical protein